LFFEQANIQNIACALMLMMRFAWDTSKNQFDVRDEIDRIGKRSRQERGLTLHFSRFEHA